MSLSNKINKFIFFLSLISLIIFTILNLNTCFTLPPHGYINGYSSLVYSKKFCIKDYEAKVIFETNSEGARILKDSDSKDFVKVFGDSQALGLDVKNKADHYLNKIFTNKNFLIYAAPNNGPYEVLNSLELNAQDYDHIILNFNASTDFFRIGNDWNMYQHVHLSLNSANLFSLFPLFYDFYKLIIFYKNDYKSKIFNTKQMQNSFLELKNENLLKNTDLYFEKLNHLILKKKLSFEFIITHPYWLYDFSEDSLVLNNNVLSKYEDLIFEISMKYPNIIFSKPQYSLNIERLTYDQRHLRSNIFTFNN